MGIYTNTSSNAVNKNVIIPEVYAELVNEKIAGHCVMAQAADVLGDLMGNVGETLTFPKVQYIGDAEDITVGQPIPTTSLKHTTTQATIKEVAPDGVTVYDYDDLVALGRALETGAGQQGIAISRKIDTDLINAAYATPLKKALAADGVVTFDEMNDILGLYGDDANADDFAFIAIHSKYVPSFLKMDGFVSADVTHTADRNGIQLNNLLGYFRGIAVVVTDRLVDTASSEYFILAVKKHALAIIPKETVNVEVARDAARRQSIIYTSQFYACALIDDAGIVLGKHTLPSA